MYVYAGRYIPSDEALFGQRHYTKTQLSERKYWDIANGMYLFVCVCVYFSYVCTYMYVDVYVCITAGDEFNGKVTIIIIFTTCALKT